MNKDEKGCEFIEQQESPIQTKPFIINNKGSVIILVGLFVIVLVIGILIGRSVSKEAGVVGSTTTEVEAQNWRLSEEEVPFWAEITRMAFYRAQVINVINCDIFAAAMFPTEGDIAPSPLPKNQKEKQDLFRQQLTTLYTAQYALEQEIPLEVLISIMFKGNEEGWPWPTFDEIPDINLVEDMEAKIGRQKIDEILSSIERKNWE